jgi:hypothetical protein
MLLIAMQERENAAVIKLIPLLGRRTFLSTTTMIATMTNASSFT